MIASGEKKEEYRELKDYWMARLCNFDWVSRNNNTSYRDYSGYKYFDAIVFKNGYGKNAPTITVKFEGIEQAEGKKQWGAEPGKEYFVIKLGNRIK